MISFLKYGNNEEIFSDYLLNIKESFSQAEVSSKYNISSNSSSSPNRISWNLWEAVKTYAGYGRKFFIGKNANCYVGELESTEKEETQLFQISKKTGEINIKAAVAFRDSNGNINIRGGYIIATQTSTGFNGTGVLLTLFPLILAEEEANGIYSELAEYASHPNTDPWWDETKIERFTMVLALFTDNVYRRIKNADFIPMAAALPLPNEQKDIKMFQKKVLSQNFSTVNGEPRYFKSITFKELMEELKFHSDYSNEESLLVPEMDAHFEWSEWIKEAAFMANKSQKYTQPIKNFFFVGPSGCGKTEGAKAIASLTGLVYDHVTCQPEMELFDFIGQIYPNTDPSTRISMDSIRKELDFPSIDDIMVDKEGSYIRMHGVESSEDMTESDVIADMVSSVQIEFSKRFLESNDFTFVEGGFTRAIRHGYLFEIQEIGVIKKAGVAVGLNAILEAGSNAFMTLPTGEVLHRNPNTLIVFTSNDEYEGTNNLNQSVLSRIGHVVYFDNASPSCMAKRTKGIVFDFPDDSLLYEMAKIIKELSDYLKEHDISDGICGQRELTNWAIESTLKMEFNEESELSAEILRETCQKTVLNKVSQCGTDIEEVARAIIDAKWGEYSYRV